MNKLKEERPWGNYEILKKENGFWVKRIEVNPGQRLSLQKHHKRTETWVIVEGNGIVQLGNKEIEVKRGSNINVKVEEAHRITNKGNTPVVFIEIAFGSYLEEDDIVRIEDDYNRT